MLSPRLDIGHEELFIYICVAGAVTPELTPGVAGHVLPLPENQKPILSRTIRDGAHLTRDETPHGARHPPHSARIIALLSPSHDKLPTRAKYPDREEDITLR